MNRPTATTDRGARLRLARHALTKAGRMADLVTPDAAADATVRILSSLEYLLVAVDALIAEAEEGK